MAATIGIKIANGEFYSIVEENSSVKKRLVLTTVHDKQRSVQIDLYKSFTKTMADALYIGSLVVENIQPRPKGDPSIELVINSGNDGIIAAEAINLDPAVGKEAQYLNVSLKSIDEGGRDLEIPDFELEEPELPPEGLYGKAEAINRNRKRGRTIWPVIIGAALILIGLCLGLWYFLLRNKGPAESAGTTGPVANASAGSENSERPVSRPEPSSPSAAQPAPQPQPEPSVEPPLLSDAGSELAAIPEPPEPAPEPSASSEPLPSEPPAPPAVIEAPTEAPAPVIVERTRPVPPVRSYRVPAAIPRNGAPYRIRWGDTLWDIAEAFYRNPWLYPRIARFNNIRNPDLIISGRTIRIPPRN